MTETQGTGQRDGAPAPDPAYRKFVSYIDRSREYYGAQGYEKPYRWATHDDVPFTALPRPLAQCRVGLVTTVELPVPRTRVYAEPVDPAPARLETDKRFWDKDATHTDDLDSFLPIHRMQEFAAEGRIGSLSPNFYGIPTEYSQRRTRDEDAPELLRLMREDNVDVALLAAL